ncbi:MAG: S-formylglutathione hydrolase FrmB [Rhodothermales bacterium]|jgi:S-formylglutathione hydrolase FrmB
MIQRYESRFLLLVALGLSASASGAQAQRGQILEGQILHSEVLGRDWPYTVYLPSDYASSERSYPVVYLLHGLGGDHTGWIRRGDASMTADSLIAASAIPQIIMIIPDGFVRSMWVDSDPETGFGAVETAFMQDLVPHVDGAYRTIPTRDARMIGGLSMGGYGALRLAFKYPEAFGAVAALSPAIWRTFPQGPPVGDEPPTPAFGVPFDPARWEAETPWAYIPNLVANAGTAPLQVYLSAGDDDPFHQLIDGTTDLYLTLRAADIKAELRITDGGHTWAVWDAALADVLPFFADVIRRRR